MKRIFSLYFLFQANGLIWFEVNILVFLPIYVTIFLEFCYLKRQFAIEAHFLCYIKITFLALWGDIPNISEISHLKQNIRALWSESEAKCSIFRAWDIIFEASFLSYVKPNQLSEAKFLIWFQFVLWFKANL